MQETPHTSPFDTIRQVDESGNEYWSARELYKILGYSEWRNFNNVVIKRAMKACEENGRAVADHFVRSYKTITGGKGAKQQVEDVLLSRYAAYLVVMNGDPKMSIVAMGQEYFAEQTRRQEIADELALMSEDELRLLRRGQTPGWHHARGFTDTSKEHPGPATHRTKTHRAGATAIFVR